jgi:hypothetical protein
MPTARAIFADPEKFLDLLTAPDDGVAERQFLDRKQAPAATPRQPQMDQYWIGTWIDS